MSVAKKLLQNAPAEFMNRDRVLVDVEVIREAAATITAQAAEIVRLKEALKAIRDMPGPVIDGPTGACKFLAHPVVAEIANAALRARAGGGGG